MKTYFSATIGLKSRPTCMVVARDTLAELLADLADSFAYYRICADWHDMRIETREVCAECHGAGEVSAARRGYKRCPNCKGKPLVSSSAADVKPMSETTCIELRNKQREAIAAYHARQSA